ncbi:hypothetical protein Ancab_024591 [Ancistrocladus abbreviatus]
MQSLSLKSSMASKRQYLPILFLFIFALFLFSHYQFSLTPSITPSSIIHLSPPKSTSRNFSLTIKVLAYDRLSSLSRCLTSLSSAHYGGDTVNLHIFIDHFKQLNVSDSGSASIDAFLNNSRRILDFVDGFSWKFGEKLVHYRTVNVGLQAQWLEAWWPSSDDEFAFVVEDDLEVSPLYYKFLKGLIVKYYYNKSNFSPSIYGASLQRPRFVPGKHGNKMKLDSETRVFLYQLVGTWGQLLFPKPWKEFRIWYDIHKAKGVKPFLEGMVTTGWYKRMGERIWTPWFIKFIHSRGYFNIYSNFLHERALSISHRDAGANYRQTVGPDSNLLDESSLDFDLLDMKPLSDLKWYDFCFREVLPDRVARELKEVGTILFSMQKQKPVLLVSLFKASEPITRNLLCHLERLNIRNYILVGPASDFLLDLARRGHPVIDADGLFDSIKAYKSLRIRKATMELIKDIVIKAYIIRKCLVSGFDSWLVESNMLSISNSPHLDSVDTMYDFYASKDSGFFYVRSSHSSRKIWDENFAHQIAKVADSSTSEDLLLKDGRNFVIIVSKLLEKQGTKFKNADKAPTIWQLDSMNIDHSSIGDKHKMILWPSDMSLDSVQKQLEELGFWLIDSDSSCKAVVCHQL